MCWGGKEGQVNAVITAVTLSPGGQRNELTDWRASFSLKSLAALGLPPSDLALFILILPKASELGSFKPPQIDTFLEFSLRNCK